MAQPTNQERPSGLLGWAQAHPGTLVGIAALALVATGVMAAALIGGSDDLPSNVSVSPGDYAGEELALVGVKIDNADAARPQVGLNEARYVVEAPVEGGMTRFLAFFESGDALVGPIRSARPVDADLVGVFSETLVSTGGRPFVLGPLEGNGIVLVGGGAEDPFQALERPVPHNLFVALAQVPDPSPRTVGVPIGELPESNGEVSSIEVAYPRPVTWAFEDGLYTRSEGGEEASLLAGWDAEPEPFTAETVVILEVNQRSAGYQDVNGAEVPTFDVIGSGRVWVHHLGSVTEGTWSRSSLDDGYIFSDGESTFGIPSSRTFIHLVPRPDD